MPFLLIRASTARWSTVRRLAPSGFIDGIEVYHPRNTEEDQQELLTLCRQNGLLITGGTDFHGSYASRRANPLATCVTDEENLKGIFELHRKKRLLSFAHFRCPIIKKILKQQRKVIT